MNSNTLGPFLPQCDSSVLPLLNHQQDLIGLQARICICQTHNLPCSYAPVTIDVAGKKVVDYIPHHLILTCWQDAYNTTCAQSIKCSNRRLAATHHISQSWTEMAFANHPPTRTRQFAAAIRKRETARLEKGKTVAGDGVGGTALCGLWRCKHNSQSCSIRTYKNSIRACVSVMCFFYRVSLLSIFSVGLSGRVPYYFLLCT